MTATPIEIIGAALFAIAILHTFATKFFERLAHAGPRHAGLWHLLGEVEVVFGFWSLVLVLAMVALSGTDKTIAIAPTVANCLLLAATGQGINDSNFTAAAGYTLLSNGASTWYGNGGLSSYSLGVENLDSGAAGSRSIGLVGQDSFASGISAIALKALVIDPNSACVAHLD